MMAVARGKGTALPRGSLEWGHRADKEDARGPLLPQPQRAPLYARYPRFWER